MKKLSLCLLTGAIACTCLLLLANGCRRNRPAAGLTAEEKAAAEMQLQSEVSQVLDMADQTLSEGQTNEAIASVEKAFGNRAFAAFRPQILDSLLQVMLRCGRVDDARQRALTASTDPTLSGGVCGLFYRFCRESGDMAGALAWSAEIANRPGVPLDVRRQAFVWNIEDHIAMRNDDQALSTLGQSFLVLKPAEGLSLVRLTIEALFSAGRVEGIEQVLTLAAGLKASPVEVEHLAMATRVRIASARGEWAALTNAFPGAAGILTDGELDGLLRAVIPAATKAGKRTVVDQCAETVLFSPTAARTPTAVATAVRIWSESAMESDKGAFPGRLAAMLRAKVPAAMVGDQYIRFYYTFTEQPVPLKELIALGERLAPLVEDEETRNEVKIKVLDGCFLVQDYDRALTMLESRIPGPGRNEQWHKTAIVKVKAHRALLRKEPREAVAFFRDFMQLLRESKDAEISDPVTGLLFPREMVLGRNAKRIGDILASIPDAAESAKAYAEAQELYAQAMKATKDADAIKVIATELAALPKADSR